MPSEVFQKWLDELTESRSESSFSNASFLVSGMWMQSLEFKSDSKREKLKRNFVRASTLDKKLKLLLNDEVLVKFAAAIADELMSSIVPEEKDTNQALKDIAAGELWYKNNNYEAAFRHFQAVSMHKSKLRINY